MIVPVCENRDECLKVKMHCGNRDCGNRDCENRDCGNRDCGNRDAPL